MTRTLDVYVLYLYILSLTYQTWSSLTFRWVFIPWLQVELEAYADHINNTKKQADRNKILPHGQPNDIHHSTEQYGCLDFKVSHSILKSTQLKDSHRITPRFE